MSGNPPVYAFTSATVVLRDVNDNKPVFTSASETVVPYNTDVGDVAYTAQAVDADSGLNGQV